MGQTVMTRNKWRQRCAGIGTLVLFWWGSKDAKAAAENSLASGKKTVVHWVVETWGYHKVQQFYSNVWATELKNTFRHKSIHECLYQHYSQLSKCGNNPNVHRLVKRPTKYGAFIQWTIILKTLC